MSGWADRYRRLSSESSAAPGRWRTSRFEPQREIMDCICDPEVRELWLMKSSQIGWTEIVGNTVGYYSHYDPCPMLLLQPTLEMAEAWSKDRLVPMIRDTPVMRETFYDTKNRDSGTTILHKPFPGGHVTIAGANSPASLASRPIRIVLADEPDRYPASAGKEGDPVMLADKRSTTFWNRKLVAGSTPTIDGQSRVQKGFESGDQRYFMVCCPDPDCGHEQRLIWKNVKWPEGEPGKAAYACGECGVLFNEQSRNRIVKRGRWVATKPFTNIASFHISEMYSPWVSFGDMATRFLKAKKEGPASLQVWINTSLGEVWQEEGEAPSWQEVYACRMPYQSGEVPDRAVTLTCGVDVQKDRLIYSVRAWGSELTSWLIEEREMWGDTSQPEIWAKLGALLGERWGVNQMPIRLMLVDSGYRADMVYAFVRRYPQARAIKGWKERPSPISVGQVEVTRNGKKVKTGVQIWHLDTNYFKTWVHARVRWPLDQPGAWAIHENVTESYCRQIVAETKMVLENGKIEWILKAEKAGNHQLDCEMMNAAAAEMLSLQRMTQDDVDTYYANAARVAKERDRSRPWIDTDTNGGWI